MNIDFAGLGVTLANAKDFEQAFADYKKGLKAADKDAVADRKANAVDAANKAIADGLIVSGTKIIVKYNKEDVEVEVKTTPKADQKNIAIIGDVLNNKDHFLYCPKENFVRIA